jgi:hypothetical protein
VAARLALPLRHLAEDSLELVLSAEIARDRAVRRPAASGTPARQRFAVTCRHELTPSGVRTKRLDGAGTFLDLAEAGLACASNSASMASLRLRYDSLSNAAGMALELERAGPLLNATRRRCRPEGAVRAAAADRRSCGRSTSRPSPRHRRPAGAGGRGHPARGLGRNVEAAVVTARSSFDASRPTIRSMSGTSAWSRTGPPADTVGRAPRPAAVVADRSWRARRRSSPAPRRRRRHVNCAPAMSPVSIA